MPAGRSLNTDRDTLTANGDRHFSPATNSAECVQGFKPHRSAPSIPRKEKVYSTNPDAVRMKAWRDAAKKVLVTAGEVPVFERKRKRSHAPLHASQKQRSTTPDAIRLQARRDAAKALAIVEPVKRKRSPSRVPQPRIVIPAKPATASTGISVKRVSIPVERLRATIHVKRATAPQAKRRCIPASEKRATEPQAKRAPSAKRQRIRDAIDGDAATPLSDEVAKDKNGDVITTGTGSGIGRGGRCPEVRSTGERDAARRDFLQLQRDPLTAGYQSNPKPPTRSP